MASVVVGAKVGTIKNQLNFKDMGFEDLEEDICFIAKRYQYMFKNDRAWEWKCTAQELRLHLWRKLHLYKGLNGASLRTFANRVMYNKIKELARKQTPTVTLYLG